jgi:hypothetical protein
MLDFQRMAWLRIEILHRPRKTATRFTTDMQRAVQPAMDGLLSREL